MGKAAVSAIFCMTLLCLHGLAEGKSIMATRHNLSTSGLVPAKATADRPVCEFCHAPHRQGPARPLWNRELSEAVYITYQSSTLKAALGQPNGASKLCLSCHDGTIALGVVRSNPSSVPSAGGTMRTLRGKTNLGLDLSDDHPISFVYDSSLAARDGQLAYPSALKRPVRLDRYGQLQCTACHDPHDDQYGKFLVMDNTSSALCTTCHQMIGWQMASHRLSNASWNGIRPNPWPHTAHREVAANGCENCHQPHTAGGREWLLNSGIEEENCYPCHNGNVASKNVQKEFQKPYRHPVENNRGVHRPTEDPLWAARHVECADCHNSHAANASRADPPQISGKLAQLSGISSTGSRVWPLHNEYELCYRCHADNPGSRPPVVIRTIFEKNLRQLFKRSNASYHPVEAVGRNPDVPSLIFPRTTSSLIYCTDCHNSNAGPKAGGIGPNGPHGSIWSPLLERQLTTTDRTAEGPQVYALCYKCHDRNNILSNRSFPQHRKHVVDVRAPCTACHEPHGVVSSTHLINFDKTIVTPNQKGILRFEDRGRFAGACFLKCHNNSHNPKRYP